MPKSTKILMITLVIFTVVGIILAVLNSEGLLAQTPPGPGEPQQNTVSDNIIYNVKTYEKKPESEWKAGRVDSGITLSLECAAEEQINNAQINNNQYSLTIHWKVEIDPADTEHTSAADIEWQTAPVVDNPPKTDINGQIMYGQNGASGEGIVTHTFELGKTYAYKIKLTIKRMDGHLEGYPDSNTCGVRKTENPEETIGDEIGTGSRGSVGGGGSGIQECKEKCAHDQGCGHVMDPICNGFCSFNCYILQLMADLFNWSFGFLTNAVGIS
jgi:hypothetical protein